MSLLNVSPDHLERLTGRRLMLVDNRIVAGSSTWVAVAQPITVCTLHPKQNKAPQRAFVEAILAIANAAIASLEERQSLDESVLTGQ